MYICNSTVEFLMTTPNQMAKLCNETYNKYMHTFQSTSATIALVPVLCLAFFDLRPSRRKVKSLAGG